MDLAGPLYADRSERGKLRVTGPQRSWFLDQILTQSIQDMKPGDAREAAMITVHGRMTAYMEILATDDALLLHFEPELRDGLADEMSRYVFATPVDIEDVTDAMGLILVTGAGWDESLEQLDARVLAHASRSLGIPAAHLWVDRARVEPLLAELEGRGFERATEDEVEAVRIAHRVRRWGRGMA